MYSPNRLTRYLLILMVLVTMGGCKTSPTNKELSSDSNSTLNAEPISNTEVLLKDDSSGPLSGSLLLGKFHLFPRETSGWDENGWSIIVPSDDSRLIYVSSSSGSDESGEYVAPNTIVDINDPKIIRPYKTIQAALSHARNGYPDWVLLKRGDVWSVTDMLSVSAGRSIDERSVITSYGAGNQRPVLKILSAKGFRIWSGVDFVAILGLSLYAEQRDPKSPQFLSWGQIDNRTGIYSYQAPGEVKQAILIENNDINYFSGGITLTGEGYIEDVVVRRNIIRNSYSELSHSQGIYAVRASVLLEENIFDHNGWYKQQVGNGNDQEQGQATFFNHNSYFSDAVNTISRGNIFLRASSIHQKWTANSPSNGDTDQIVSKNILVTDNLFVGGEIGISAGGNTDYNSGPRWRNINLIDNVLVAIGRDQPTNRTLGWYIEIDDWQSGNICGNYLLHNDNSSVNNLIGIDISGHSSDLSVTENTISGLIKSTSDGKGAINIGDIPKENIVFSGNNIQLSNSNMRIITANNIEMSKYNDNTYFSDAEPDVWFSMDGESYDFDGWVFMTEDLTSRRNIDHFVDEDRSFASYLSSIGLPESIDLFVERAVQQPHASWNQELSAAVINEYIRAGYGGKRCEKPAESFFMPDDL